MIALTPASIASCGTVGEREEGVGGERGAVSSSGWAACAFSIAMPHRVHAAHLTGADPDRGAVAAITIALERT